MIESKELGEAKRMKPLNKSIIGVAILLFALVTNTNIYAQIGDISGKVISEKQPLAYASIILRSAADSAIAKTGVTNFEGSYIFKSISFGQYFIDVSYLGKKPYSSNAFSLSAEEFSVKNIVLETASEKLKEVMVIDEKPLIEVLADRTVFNVQNNINTAGNNGFELLRKAPGVVLDNDNNLILEVKTGVQLFIDGKPSILAGSDLQNFLQSLQASDIESIELITQPSSKYDAAGTAGIINIKLKKDKRYGTNGTISAGVSQGRNTQYNSSISLNNRNKKTNLFGTYSNNTGKRWSFIDFDRQQEGVQYFSETDNLNDRTAHNARLGFDYFLSKKHTIGILINANLHERSETSETSTKISPLDTRVLSQILRANNGAEENNSNLSGNINYVFEDTTGHRLAMDLDYGEYRRDRTNTQPNSYYDGVTGELEAERNYFMETPTDVDILAFKADYSQNLFKGVFGLGAKYSNVKTQNAFNFYNVEDEQKTFNDGRSNSFDYSENINAVYVNYSQKIKKWSFQGGLRAEQTISDGMLISAQESEDDNVKRDYTNFFPSAGLTFMLSRKHSFAINYGRRIQRPNYQSLNPFESQIDELAFRKGNPFLQPQYTNNIKLSHTYNYRFVTSLSYSHIKDFFAQITDTLGATKSFLTPRNIATQEVWSLGLSYPFKINKWWSTYVSVNGFHASYKGSDEKFVSVNRSTLNFYGQSTFSFKRGLSLEISGWANSPSVWGGTYLTKTIGALNLAAQQKFLNDKLVARLALNDVFFSSPWRADMQFGGLYINGTGGRESRQLRLNLSYAFGNNQVKAERKRKTGLEDEKGRLGG